MPGKKGEIPPQLQAHIDDMRAKKAAREGALAEAEGAVASEDASEQLEELASTLPGDLGQVFLELKRATEGKDAEACLTALSEIFRKLPADTVAQLRETAAFKAVTARAAAVRKVTKPGDPIYNEQGKIVGYQPWRREDYIEAEPIETWVHFIGEENLRFYVNGVGWDVFDGLEVGLPPSIYDYYIKNRQERRQAATGQGAYQYLQSASGGHAVKG